jgi:DNA-binding CsgD family transcriptional regulator/PAS domain-containing protein
MDNNINSGLLTRNKVQQVTEQEKLQENNYLEAVKAFARLTYESVYVIDYTDMSFEYVSDNPLFLCGYTPAEVLEMGYDFYFKNVPRDDLKLLTQINEAGFNFYEKQATSDKKLYSITYDFHLLNRDGKQMLINHKLTPLFLTMQGKMWKAMCVVSISGNQNAGNVYIHKQGSDEIWQLNISSNAWHKLQKPKLNKRETEVLRLHAQGLTITQIAERLFVVPDTVKYYRRQIFERLEVKNMTEALSVAVNRRII